MALAFPSLLGLPKPRPGERRFFVMKTNIITREVSDPFYDLAMTVASSGSGSHDNYQIIVEIDQDGYEVFVKNKKNGRRAAIPGKSLVDMLLNAELAAYTATLLNS